MSDAHRPVRTALLSVSDKAGLVPFAQGLAAAGVSLIATGGTGKALKAAGLDIRDVAEVTGSPEMLDGRVKTLHPSIHGGILARRDRTDHMDTLAEHGIGAIDLVVVNLYPFSQTMARGADVEACIESIDIGGPAMIRAAAKNMDGVGVITDPADYDAVLEEIGASGGLSADTRRRLAQTAFAHTGHYDAMIAQWLAGQTGNLLPRQFVLAGTHAAELRYGENPHQSAALYTTAATGGVAHAEQVQGKPISYNNLLDADAALSLVREFPQPAAVVIKHANPCGVAVADNLAAATAAAIAADPISAYGGIVGLNRPVDAASATALIDLFLEVVVAPDATPEAREILSAKKALRVLLTGDVASAPTMAVRTLSDGLLVQSTDSALPTADDLHTVTDRKPDAREVADMLFAQTVAKHVKSNAIVLTRDGATVGIGGGQTSRVDAARIAVERARSTAPDAEAGDARLQGAVVASDAFFPFPDGLEICAEAGITAAIQPGGAKRDDAVIETANQRGMAMVFTGTRHFRH